MVSIAGIIRRLEDRQIALALKTIEGGTSHVDYLLGTGRVRECRSLIQMLEKLAEQARKAPAETADDEIGDLDPDEPDEEEEPVRIRRAKPRGWGG